MFYISYHILRVLQRCYQNLSEAREEKEQKTTADVGLPWSMSDRFQLCQLGQDLFLQILTGFGIAVLNDVDVAVFQIQQKFI